MVSTCAPVVTGLHAAAGHGRELHVARAVIVGVEVNARRIRRPVQIERIAVVVAADLPHFAARERDHIKIRHRVRMLRLRVAGEGHAVCHRAKPPGGSRRRASQPVPEWRPTQHRPPAVARFDSADRLPRCGRLRTRWTCCRASSPSSTAPRNSPAPALHLPSVICRGAPPSAETTNRCVCPSSRKPT